ncbi:MAG: hypothetical protein ACLGJC_27485 [Alphaproteobacteria bacterium]
MKPQYELINALISRYHARLGLAIATQQPDSSFIIFFDDDGREIPFSTVFEKLPKENHGLITAVSPAPAFGRYHAHLRYEGDGAQRGIYYYEFSATLWDVHITVYDMGHDRVMVKYKIDAQNPYIYQMEEFILKIV